MLKDYLKIGIIVVVIIGLIVGGLYIFLDFLDATKIVTYLLKAVGIIFILIGGILWKATRGFISFMLGAISLIIGYLIGVYLSNNLMDWAFYYYLR